MTTHVDLEAAVAVANAARAYKAAHDQQCECEACEAQRELHEGRGDPWCDGCLSRWAAASDALDDAIAGFDAALRTPRVTACPQCGEAGRVDDHWPCCPNAPDAHEAGEAAVATYAGEYVNGRVYPTEFSEYVAFPHAIRGLTDGQRVEVIIRKARS